MVKERVGGRGDVPERASKHHTRCIAAGVHWCGWVPSSDEIDEVAKRVWPWYSVGGCSRGSPHPSRKKPRARRRSKLGRSVRLPLTTRARRPA